jgi:thiol-disulfide isomerase/thioredoxin
LENTHTAPIREYLLAINLKRLLRESGATPAITQIFDRFKGSYPDSRYTATLTREIDKYQELGEGKEAKDFIATYPDGKEFRLSDLKGKVVYLDTWATWCGPCIGEFPSSKKMVKHYQDNPEVVFLFVSVDSNLDKWKAYLNQGKAPQGIHVNQNPETQDYKASIQNLYRMTGIPHYVVIDQAGKIKINNAPRPSDKESYSLLDGLLKKQP